MLLEVVALLALAVSAAAPADLDAALAAPARGWAAVQDAAKGASTEAAAFHPAERIVSNWRLEAAQELELAARIAGEAGRGRLAGDAALHQA